MLTKGQWQSNCKRLFIAGVFDKHKCPATAPYDYGCLCWQREALTWEHQNTDPLLDKFFILRVTIMAASPMINIIMVNGPNSGAAYEPISIMLFASSFTWTLVTLNVSLLPFSISSKK
jgi:hypothetical protein